MECAQRPGYVPCRTLNLPFSFHFTNASAGSKRRSWRSLAFAACAGFPSQFSSRRFLPAWHVAIVGRFHFILRKPMKATVLTILYTSKGPFLPIFQSFWTDFQFWSSQIDLENWSQFTGFKFLILKVNLPNWSKFLISSLQFDSAKFQFSWLISNSSRPIQSTDFQSPKSQLDSR